MPAIPQNTTYEFLPNFYYFSWTEHVECSGLFLSILEGRAFIYERFPLYRWEECVLIAWMCCSACSPYTRGRIKWSTWFNTKNQHIKAWWTQFSRAAKSIIKFQWCLQCWSLAWRGMVQIISPWSSRSEPEGSPPHPTEDFLPTPSLFPQPLSSTFLQEVAWCGVVLGLWGWRAGDVCCVFSH